MTVVERLYERLLEGFGVEDLAIPAAYVKFYDNREIVATAVLACHVDEETIMACQAARHAAAGQSVYLTAANIGCIAAAITFGLVDQNQTAPLIQPPRLYTNLMQAQSGQGDDFVPPAPKDFTNGEVYACRHTGRHEYCLFGPEDSGRFKNQAIAAQAIKQMAAIQPPTMQGVFIFAHSFNEVVIEPDVVVLSVRPVELTRLLQGYQYMTGTAVQAHMNPLRAVDADLMVRPYLTGDINISPYCLGSRAVARFETDRMGIGIPFAEYKILLEGLARSIQGYPFKKYLRAP